MTQQVLKLGHTVWNPRTLELAGPGGTRIELSNKARDMLACLTDAAGDVVARETLVNTVWPATPVDETAIAGVIDEIRTALADHDGAILRSLPDTGLQLGGDWVEVETPAEHRRHHHKWIGLALLVGLAVVWVLLER